MTNMMSGKTQDPKLRVLEGKPPRSLKAQYRLAKVVEADPLEHLGRLPRWMPARAKKWAKEKFKLFQEHDLVTGFDREGFLQLAMAWYNLEQAHKVIVKEGFYVEGKKKGVVKKHPGLAALKQAEDTFLRLSDRFGMNPLARARIPKSNKKAKSRMKEMIA